MRDQMVPPIERSPHRRKILTRTTCREHRFICRLNDQHTISKESSTDQHGYQYDERTRVRIHQAATKKTLRPFLVQQRAKPTPQHLPNAAAQLRHVATGVEPVISTQEQTHSANGAGGRFSTHEHLAKTFLRADCGGHLRMRAMIVDPAVVTRILSSISGNAGQGTSVALGPQSEPLAVAW